VQGPKGDLAQNIRPIDGSAAAEPSAAEPSSAVAP
jgi:hypothetical protein